MRVVTISVNGPKQAEGFFEAGSASQPRCDLYAGITVARVAELEDGDFRPDGYEGYFLDAEDVATAA